MGGDTKDAWRFSSFRPRFFEILKVSSWFLTVLDQFWCVVWWASQRILRIHVPLGRENEGFLEMLRDSLGCLTLVDQFQWLWVLTSTEKWEESQESLYYPPGEAKDSLRFFGILKDSLGFLTLLD